VAVGVLIFALVSYGLSRLILRNKSADAAR